MPRRDTLHAVHGRELELNQLNYGTRLAPVCIPKSR
jgi:hypothetical protein